MCFLKQGFRNKQAWTLMSLSFNAHKNPPPCQRLSKLSKTCRLRTRCPLMTRMTTARLHATLPCVTVNMEENGYKHAPQLHTLRRNKRHFPTTRHYGPSTPAPSTELTFTIFVEKAPRAVSSRITNYPVAQRLVSESRERGPSHQDPRDDKTFSTKPIQFSKM